MQPNARIVIQDSLNSTHRHVLTNAHQVMVKTQLQGLAKNVQALSILILYQIHVLSAQINLQTVQNVQHIRLVLKQFKMFA